MSFHILTVGWDYSLIEDLFNLVAEKSAHRFSHVAHPKYTAEDWPVTSAGAEMHFLRHKLREKMPYPDRQLLSSLQRDDVPTLHNMIMGDRIVSKVKYIDALRYATFLTRRLTHLFTELNPSVVITGFDAIHSSLALAVAKKLDIPVFALHFSVIPPGLACFCDQMSPAARVKLKSRYIVDSQLLAETSIDEFYNKKIKAHAYIAPMPPSILGRIKRSPQQAAAVYRTIRKSRQRRYLQFTEAHSGHDIWSTFALLRAGARARKALAEVDALSDPPDAPYVFFGLHLQPESSIDVWAPFFSNQMWVIELISRSIPPSHRLLVKVHKSDVSNYSRGQLERMSSFPGVELVRPFVDSRAFIEKADLVIAIQGTIGLETALLGKPVIMLADSPVSVFPNAARIGALQDLPKLIQAKLKEPIRPRSEIARAYASYLSAFLPASLNDWEARRSPEEIDNYVVLFDALQQHLINCTTTAQKAGENQPVLRSESVDRR